MPVYKATFGGRTLKLTADTPEQAANAARLFMAGRGRADEVAQERAQSEKDAEVSSQMLPTESTGSPLTDAAMAGIGYPSATNLEDAASNLATGATMLSAGPLASGFAAAPIATGKALLGGLAGSAIGNEAGDWVGNRVPGIGGDLLGKVLGIGGGLIGGGVGGTVAPKLNMKQVLSMLPGKGGMLADMLGVGRGAAAAGIETAASKAALAERALAIKEAESAARIADRTRLTDARVAAIEARASGKAAGVPKAARRPSAPEAQPTEGATALQPEAEFIDEAAVKVLPFEPRPGTVKPATNLGGKAKPGPAPTPPDKLEETLRASLNAIKEKKASKAALEAIAEKVEASPLQAPRIQVGAQRVGKTVGMTKEQVRQQAGPVLGEMRGEASPILPIEPFKKIIDTMKAIPMAEREAYVARATSGKTQWQVENIRRTLEHLGLLLPAGAVAGGALSE